MELLYIITGIFILFLIVFVLYLKNNYKLEQKTSQYLDDTIQYSYQSNMDYELQESDVQQTKI